MASFPLLSLLLLLITQASILSCAKNNTENIATGFDSIPVVRPVAPIILETSGLADSKRNKGFLWVHEDSGNPSQLYLLGHDGKVVKTVALQGITNRDWEELQLAGNKLYLADIGDNQAKNDISTIYIFEEPAYTADAISDIITIQFKYADGPRDAEAFLVDEQSGDIFIITKSDKPTRIYKLAFPYSNTSVNTATQVGELKYSGVVAAVISPDRKEIIIKTYVALQHYKHNPQTSIAETLQKPFEKLPYQPEPQGETVAFAADNSGYFTLSEKGLLGAAVKLYFYKRK